MFTDFFRFMAVMVLDGAGYNSDIGARQYEMGIAIVGAYPLTPLYPVAMFVHTVYNTVSAFIYNIF